MTPQSNTPEGKVTVAPDHKMYGEVLAAFMQFMRDELASNYLKGDRNGPNGWIHYKDKKGWLNELYYHVGKLQSAMMNADAERIKENCADIANLAMMTLDVNIDLTRYVPDEHYQSTSKDTQIADLTRQLESAREETTIYRESMDIIKLITEGHFSALRTLLMKIPKDKLYAVLQSHPNLRYEKQEIVDALVEALEKIKTNLDTKYADEGLKASMLREAKNIINQALLTYKSQNP